MHPLVSFGPIVELLTPLSSTIFRARPDTLRSGFLTPLCINKSLSISDGSDFVHIKIREALVLHELLHLHLKTDLEGTTVEIFKVLTMALHVRLIFSHLDELTMHSSQLSV